MVREFGPADEVVALDPVIPGVPGPSQVRVRMLAAAINPSDLVTISGAYAHRTPLPFVPGFEGVGIVEEVGADVAESAIGDRVLPIGSSGAWQDDKIAEARWCFRVAPDLSVDQAAISYINPLTAWLMLHGSGGFQQGVRLAINAAASAIGRILIRMATAVDVRPVAIVRSARSRDLLEGLDLDAIIVTECEDLGASLRIIARTRPIDLALDAIGGPEGECLAMSLRPGGRFIHYGLLSGVPLSTDLSTRRPDLTIDHFWLRRWIHEASRDEIAERLAQAAGLIREGIAASMVEAHYPLEAVREALRHHGRRGRSGKILIRW